MSRFGPAGLFVTSAVVLFALGGYAVRRIAHGPVVAVEQRDKFVPVTTISPAEPALHPHTAVDADPAAPLDGPA
jgi:hypothetical protein